MSVPSADVILTIRPSSTNARTALLSAALPALGMTALMVWQIGIWGAGIIVGIIGLGAGYSWLYVRRARIDVTTSELISSGAWRRHTWARIDVAAAVVAPMHLSVRDSRVFTNLFLLDHAGHKLLRLIGAHWSDDDIDRLTAALDVPRTTETDVISAKQLGETYPNLLPFYERRPYVFGFLIAGVTLVVIAAVVAVAFAVGG